MRSLRLAAAALAAMACLGTPRAAEGDTWRLQRIVAVNELDPNARLDTHWADSYGGLLSITVDGALLNSCPGGYEYLQFGWVLPDVRELTEGAAFPVKVSASGAGYAPCKGVLAAQSFTEASGSKGITHALPDDEMKQIDEGRFYDAGAGETRAYPAGNDVGEITRDMMLDAYDPVSGRPYAYFEIRFIVHGSPGELRLVYVFSKGAPPVVPPTSGEPLPPPG